jgi:WD40 repeat protein
MRALCPIGVWPTVSYWVSGDAIDTRRDSSRTRYDAFLSYSRAVDDELAPALQAALQRFAKPWYRARAKSVFRDDASLSANPGLWSSIEQALDGARYFVLLASPQAAESKWVGKEVSHWLSRNPRARLLLVLTSGEILWDDTAGDFDWRRTTALPPALAHVFAEEPRYVDARWAQTHEHLSISDPRFRDAVADLAAALHERPKDELIGEEVRQHRRTVRIVRGTVALLSALVLVATVAAIVALRERNTAREQRDRAEREARIATSRGLAGQALLRLRARPDLGLLLALEAYRLSPTADARQAAIEGMQRRQRMLAILRPRELVSRAVDELVFSPDGEVLAARADAKIVLWSLAKRNPVRVLEQRSLGSIAFSADGDTLAVPDHNAIRLWDLSAARATSRLLPATGDTVLALTFSRDGELLASGGRDGTVLVWDAARATRLRLLLPPGTDVPEVRSAVLSTAFSPDRRWLVAGRADGTIGVWNASTWRAGRPLRTDGDAVSKVLFSPDGGKLVAVNRGGRAWLWDFRTRRRIGRLGTGVDVLSVAFSARGETLAVGDSEGTVQLFDPSTRKPLGTPLLDGGPALSALSFSPTEMLASGDRQGTIVLWDTRPAGTSRLRGLGGPVRRAVFDPRRRFVAVAVDTTITLWDLAAGARVGRPLLGLKDAVLDVAFSPNGTMLAAGARDGTIALWQVATQRLLATIRAYRGFTTAVSFSPDGTTLASAGDDVGSLPVKLWNVRGRALASPPLEHPKGFPTSVAFSPDGQTLASGDASGAIILWDVKRRRPLSPLVGHARNVERLVFSPDGKTLASGSADSTLQLWNVTAHTRLSQPFENPIAFRLDLAFSSDGKTLASTALSADAHGDLTLPQVRLWDMPTRRLLGEPLKADENVVALAFERNGKRLNALAEDGTLVSWDGTLWTRRYADFRRRFCEVVDRNLTRSEWTEFLPDQPYRRTCA